MDAFDQIAKSIIKAQERIIGPIAVELAEQVPGITLNKEKTEVTLTGDKKQILETLIQKYRNLFGQVSDEVCKEATRSILSNLPKDQIPSFLQ